MQTVRFTCRPAALTLFVSALAIVVGCGGNPVTTPSGSGPPSPPHTPPAVELPSLAEMLSEKSLGSATAPNVIFEFSALTCPACSDFHANTFPELKRKHIDTGNVRFVYRDIPLDATPSPNNAGLSAAMVSRCAGNERFFEALDLLYRTRTSWSGDPVRNLGPVMSGMMSQATVDACLAHTDLRTGLLQARSASMSEFGITSVPTFIVNGNRVIGSRGLAALEEHFK
jgi:protein-disulfide isomerase